MITYDRLFVGVLVLEMKVGEGELMKAGEGELVRLVKTERSKKK